MFVFAHLSDPHLDGGDRSAERTRRVLAHLDGLPRPLDAILVTGDIADHGLVAEYEDARAALVARCPVLPCPGNHDERGAYRKGLLDEDDEVGPINRAHRLPGAVFLMCDSSIPGRDDGHLDDETIAWLAGELAVAPSVPTFVCFHHPPVALHNPMIDAIRQRGEHRLAALVGDHPQVVALLCGHAHTAAASTFAGRPLLVAPGIASTLRLPWEPGGDLDRDAPPGFAFHVLDDAGRLTTHYRVVT